MYTDFFGLKIIVWFSACIHVIGMLVLLLGISENSKKKWPLVVPAFIKLQFAS